MASIFVGAAFMAATHTRRVVGALPGTLRPNLVLTARRCGGVKASLPMRLCAPHEQDDPMAGLNPVR